MAANLHTHYDTLQISHAASDEVVRGAYRFLCQKWHPDKCSGDRAEAEGVMQELNEAYRVLSNPELRSRYDEWLVSSNVESERNGSGAEHGAAEEDPEDPVPQRRTVWWRAWYIVLTTAAAAYLVLTVISTIELAASRTGFVSVVSQIISGLALACGVGAVCIYGYSMLFPPGRDSPEWFADVSGELQDATWKEWIGGALGYLLLSGIFMASANHFDHSIKTSASEMASGPAQVAPISASSSAAAPTSIVQQAEQDSRADVPVASDGRGKLADERDAVNAQIAEVQAKIARLQGARTDIRHQADQEKQQIAALQREKRETLVDKGNTYFQLGQYADAADAFRQAADQGSAIAQYDLGALYMSGQGVPQDDAAAVMWFQKAAGQGYASAQNNLGYMYHNGKGVPRDDVKAVEWFQKAVQQGDAYGQFNLGRRYALGEGVPQDLVQADQWLLLAQTGGQKEAEAAVSDTEKQMTPAQIDEAHRRARAWQSSRDTGQQETDPSSQTPQASAPPESAGNI